MNLFQKSVLKKHLQSLDKATIEAAWQRYAGHFLDEQFTKYFQYIKEGTECKEFSIFAYKMACWDKILLRTINQNLYAETS